MCASAPDLLRVDDLIGSREHLDCQAGIQIDPEGQVSLVNELTAIESLIRVRVEEVQIVGFANLSQTVLSHPFAYQDFILLPEFQSGQWVGCAVKLIKDQAASS